MTAIQTKNLPNAKVKRKEITPQLGLVCITFSKDVRFKTITRTRYLALTENLQKRTLEELYRENLRRLHIALEYCHKRSIRLYRMSSGLFPLSDWEDNIGANIIESMSADLARIGQKAAKLGVRVVLHPDQYVVLSSDSPEIVASSIKVLAGHARIFDLMGLPQSSWALMNIHGGKSQRADNLVEVRDFQIKKYPNYFLWDGLPARPYKRAGWKPSTKKKRLSIYVIGGWSKVSSIQPCALAIAKSSPPNYVSVRCITIPRRLGVAQRNPTFFVHYWVSLVLHVINFDGLKGL